MFTNCLLAQNGSDFASKGCQQMFHFFDRHILLFLSVISILSSCSLQKNNEPYDVAFPIEFLPNSGLPTTKTKIEGKVYPLMVDLGGACTIALNKRLLENMKKEFIRTKRIIDIKGNSYETALYLVPEIKVGQMKAVDLLVYEENDDFLTKGSIMSKTKTEIPEKRELCGRIGIDLFKNNTNLFLDFKNSIMYGCDKIAYRNRDGYNIKKMTKTNFKLEESPGIVLEIETEHGVKNFILDTGASRNIMKPSSLGDDGLESKQFSLYTISQFVIGDRDFGAQQFFLFEMSPRFKNIDGILGMDFFKTHILYIDFKSSNIHVGKAEDSSY